MADDEMLVRAAIRDELSGPLDRIRSELAATGRQAQRTGRQAVAGSRGFDRMRGSAASLASGIGTKLATAAKIGGAALGIAAAGAATFGIKAAAQIQTATMNLTTMTGSAKTAGRMVKQLNAYGNATTFDTGGLTEAAQQMLTYGISAKDVLPNIKMLGDISMGNQEKLSGLAYVFAQVQGNGHLMGQDLLQMINNGFNPLQDMAKRTGKSMGTLREEMSKGKISFDDVRQSMVDATSKGGTFYKGASNGANTLAGAWGNFTGSLESGVGMALQPVLPKLQDLLGKVSDLATKYLPKAVTAITDISHAWEQHDGKVGQARDILEKVGHVINVTFGFLKDHKGTVLTFIGVLGALAVSIAVVNAVMAINPFSLILISVALLITWLVHLYRTNDTFRAGVQELWNGVLKPFGKWLGSVLPGVFRFLGKAFILAAQVMLTGWRAVLTTAIWVFQGILIAADKGLGWVPGLGGKIKAARKGFDTFGDGVLKMLDGVSQGLDHAGRKIDELGRKHADPTITIGVRTRTDGSAPANKYAADLAVPKGVGDTATSRAHGGNLAATMAFHANAMAATGARPKVTNALLGGGGRGHGSGDHQAGRALDLQGNGLARYGAFVRASGGYASFHGTGANRHLHAVPAAGDTATSRARSRAGSATAGGIVIAEGAVKVDVHNPTSNVDVATAVQQGIEEWLRDREERA